VRCLWRHSLTSYSHFQINVLATFVDTICILFHSQSPYSLLQNFMCHHSCRSRKIFGGAKDFCPNFPKLAWKYSKENDLQKKRKKDCISFHTGFIFSNQSTSSTIFVLHPASCTSVCHFVLTINQWFSTAVLRAACGPLAHFVRLSAVFNKTSNILCNRLRSVIKRSVSIWLC